MICEYRNEKEHPVCMLGMYGGMPSRKMCEFCIEKKQNNLEFAKKQNNTTITNQAVGVAKSIINWSKSNFQITPKEELETRIKICETCEFWDSKGFNETGKCKKCGCSTWAKLKMATERCPIGKWESLKLH